MRKRKALPPGFVEHEMSSRYYALMSPAKARRLHVALVGAGAIGSYAAIALAKLGVKRFTVWDMDTVEAANVGVQAYTAQDVGADKTTALEGTLHDVTDGGVKVTCKKEFKTNTVLPPTVDVVIASLDNIPVREMVYAAARRLPRGKPILYIDPRMGAEVMEVRATVMNEKGRGFTDKTRAEYEGSFHRNVPPAPCGANSTPYCASACGALVAARVKQFVADEPIPTRVTVHFPTMNVVKGEDNAGHFKTHRSAPGKAGRRAGQAARKDRVGGPAPNAARRRRR